MTAVLKEQALVTATTSLYKTNVKRWFQRYGWLRDDQGVITRYPALKPRVVQLRMFDAYLECRRLRKPCRIMVLKPRKEGATSAAQAIVYHHLRNFSGRSGAVMGDVAGTSDTVFELFRGFAIHDDFDWGDGLGKLEEADKEHNQTDDIELTNKSIYKKVTAGSNNANRSGTIQVAYLTEVAHYEMAKGRDPMMGFLGSWADGGESSLGIMDSTAKGPYGSFYEYWMKKNDWIKIFVAWWEEPDHLIAFENELERRDFERTLDPTEREERERFNVTLENLQWRRDKLKNKCGGDPDKFAQEFPSTPEGAFLQKSRARFSLRILEQIERAALVRQPEVGDLVENNGEISFVPDDAGSVKIYEHPHYGYKYIGPYDSCTGRDQQSQGRSADPDENAIGVIREAVIEPGGLVLPPKLVAVHSSRLESEVAVEIAANLSRYYGGCLMVPEVNGCGLYPTKKLVELGVSVFMRKQPKAEAGAFEQSAGWMTTEVVRKTIIDKLGELISQWSADKPTFDVWDLKTIHQLKKFIKDETGHPTAMPGEHDDLVLMLAIGMYLRSAATEMKMNVRKQPSVDLILRRQGWRREPIQ